MAPPIFSPRSERATIFACAAALHLGLLALLVSAGSLSPAPAKPSAAMTMIAMTPDRATGRPPPPALPSRIAEPQRVLRDLMFSDQPDASASGAAGDCAALPLITQALVADPGALAAMLAAPPEVRSIADAVVLWNGGWAPAASTPDAPLAPARAAIELGLRALPDACLDEKIAGPRLIPIADGDRTMFIAIGSGNWSWRQLVEDPALTPPLALLPADRAAAPWWPWL